MKIWNLGLIMSLAIGAADARGAEGDAAFAVSPESAYSLIQTAIGDAHESIELNTYMLTNRNVTDALIEKATRENVKITVLIEGQTFGGDMLLPGKRVLDDFQAKIQGTQARFLVMTSQSGTRRYVYDHAKYMIVDGCRVFVSSENITGSAYNNRNQTGGTRGWEIYIENAALGAQLSQIFETDSDTSYGDVLPYSQVSFNVKDPGNSPFPPRQDRDVPNFAMTRGHVDNASLCTSPNSLQCVLAFIGSAKSALNLEFLSLPKVWVNHKNNTTQPSPIVAALVAAAQRGVHVRVLLNDDNAFADDNGGTSSDEKNINTVNYFRELAAQSNLPLEAATFAQKRVEVSYVHNKGMVADGNRVFVSSINGTENSVMENREVAVAVTSEDAGKYFSSVFGADWSLSSGN